MSSSQVTTEKVLNPLSLQCINGYDLTSDKQKQQPTKFFINEQVTKVLKYVGQVDETLGADFQTVKTPLHNITWYVKVFHFPLLCLKIPPQCKENQKISELFLV